MSTVQPDRDTTAVATLELPFRAPYDWPRVLRFFAGRATPGVETVEDGSYRRAIEWNGASGTLCVSRPPRRRCLVATIEGPVSAHAQQLAAPVARMFDLNATPAAIDAHLADDAWLAPLVAAAPGLRVPGAWSAFELVVRAIVGQQVSVKAATTIIGRLVQRVGERIDGHPHASTAWRFPTPAALASADLAAIGMPGKRVAALQGFAAAVASGAVAIELTDDANATASSRANDFDAMRAALLALPGIGPWTVEYVAMRAWRDANAWPATDLVLMQAIAARDPALVRATQQRTRTDAWRPWRAYAAMHLWNEIADRAGAARGG
ncbi:DNA-3-methyladenine glycosylase family protein [Paraburkholderia caballeronis]|uniref:DNA-3-methyladenine glycosylase family protein n=1 Tax=Paraburkholderia caballeronis TaxID=416943 RepID=UPI001064863E|nr:AlkA N-terminal domain-containing protein [Paraburkholderia caballeronis]TDV11073.1 DNA-3-methyladenine glycosylase II [Paraburkholderia caballeronis]TDV14237.1 DNA-3-methyladenine glycosylase II [Paraburkholderia caballeronis]TDV23402.1 DNA-3-methyladenine glycosylase II [Paraburkholderia caballeronis]